MTAHGAAIPPAPHEPDPGVGAELRRCVDEGLTLRTYLGAILVRRQGGDITRLVEALADTVERVDRAIEKRTSRSSVPDRPVEPDSATLPADEGDARAVAKRLRRYVASLEGARNLAIRNHDGATVRLITDGIDECQELAWLLAHGSRSSLSAAEFRADERHGPSPPARVA